MGLTWSGLVRRPPMRGRGRRLIVSSAMLCLASTILPACSTTRSECVVFAPIVASDADTRETKNQVAVHNSKGVKVCGWSVGEGR